MKTGLRNINITVSGPDDLEGLYEDAAADGWTRWTIYGGARPGEHVIFYYTDPVYAAVARGRVLTAPTPHDDPGNPWHGRLMSDIDDLQLFVAPLPLAALKYCFPAWRYWLQPRTNIRTPAEHTPLLTRLVEQFIRPRVAPAHADLPSVCEDYGGERARRRALRRVAKNRRPMLEALAREHGLAPEDAIGYVALNARWNPGMCFDESLGAVANYLELPPQPRRPRPGNKRAARGGQSLTERHARSDRRHAH